MQQVGLAVLSRPVEKKEKGKKMENSDDRIIQASYLLRRGMRDAALGTRPPPNSPKHAPNHRPGFGIRVFIVPMWGRATYSTKCGHRNSLDCRTARQSKELPKVVAVLFLCNSNDSHGITNRIISSLTSTGIITSRFSLIRPRSCAVRE